MVSLLNLWNENAVIFVELMICYRSPLDPVCLLVGKKLLTKVGIKDLNGKNCPTRDFFSKLYNVVD